MINKNYSLNLASKTIIYVFELKISFVLLFSFDSEFTKETKGTNGKDF